MGDHVIEYGIGDDHVPPFELERVVSVPSRRSPVLAYVDGKYYCGFTDMEHAKRALAMWRGDQEGNGRMTTTHFGDHWPAIAGRKVELVRG